MSVNRTRAPTLPFWTFLSGLFCQGIFIDSRKFFPFSHCVHCKLVIFSFKHHSNGLFSFLIQQLICIIPSYYCIALLSYFRRLPVRTINMSIAPFLWIVSSAVAKGSHRLASYFFICLPSYGLWNNFLSKCCGFMMRSWILKQINNCPNKRKIWFQCSAIFSF